MQQGASPEDRDRAGHLASRMTPIGLIPVQAILAGASPDRTPTRARCGKAARRDLWGRCRVPGTSTRQVVLGSALQLFGNRTQDRGVPPGFTHEVPEVAC